MFECYPNNIQQTTFFHYEPHAIPVKNIPCFTHQKKSIYSHLYGCDHDSLKSKAVMIIKSLLNSLICDKILF